MLITLCARSHARSAGDRVGYHTPPAAVNGDPCDPGHGDPSCKIRASGAEPVCQGLARFLLQYSTTGNTCKEYANAGNPVRPGWHDSCKGAGRDPGHTTPIDKKKPGINPGSYTLNALGAKLLGSCVVRSSSHC